MSKKENKSEDVGTSKTTAIAKKLLEESTIDKNIKEQMFLNKRNIIIIVIFTLVAIVAIILTFIFVLDINWNLIFDSLYQGFAHKIGGLWFSLLFIGIIVSVFYNWVPIAVRIRSLGYKIKFLDWFYLGFVCSFIKAITPANFVVDPFTIFWLTKKGLPTSKAAGIIGTNAFFWEIVQVIIKMPSFVICMLNVGALIKYPNGWGITILVLMVIGYFIDFIGVVFMAVMCSSKKIHYRISVIFNWFRKKLHMKYSTKSEINEKYKVRAETKRDFITYLKDWKTTIFVVLLFVFFELYTYMMVDFGMYFVQFSNNCKIGFDFGAIFNSSNMATAANRINIIPNGELGIEGILNILINTYKGWLPVPEWPGTIEELDIVREQVANNGIFMSRVFWAYFPTIIGFLTTIPVTSIYIHKRRKLNTVNKK